MATAGPAPDGEGHGDPECARQGSDEEHLGADEELEGDEEAEDDADEDRTTGTPEEQFVQAEDDERGDGDETDH